jgi:glycosyltransferase involved in cell wall biosynthesis
MKVAYIIYNDRPDSGLIKTQVVSLLIEIKKQSPQLNITLVTFWQPWVMIRYKNSIKEMHKILSGVGIGMKSYPLAIVPCRHFLYKYYLFPILRVWVTTVFRIALSRKYDVVHARSYLESLVSSKLKKLYDYKLIFDMRSLFPEENITKGAFTKTDKSYRMWKKHEKTTVLSSDISIGVSQPMVDDTKIIGPKSRVELIPCCVDNRLFQFDPIMRAKYRTIYGWEKKIVIVYEGSLSLSSWNDIRNYAKYFSFILENYPNSHFLIITPNRDLNISTIMGKYGIENSKYTIRHSTQKDLPGLLSSADIGIQVMSRSADSHTRLGVKFVEYLSCGLPVIVNSYVGGAAEIVIKHGVGEVIDIEDKDESINKINGLMNELPSMRGRCEVLVDDMFSTEICAQKYIDLYVSL